VDSDPARTIWALSDVNFEIAQGEIVGIIGRNGSGKSTLLKILSGITTPTRGEARVRGRVGTLLEVGTGFHPELTGRENIFLNGAILGMSASEVKRRYDEIADFSGVENFLGTPVKRYSTGMRSRLGFSIAAHLDVEVLLVDEVLSVGDAEFQRKCLGKMEEVGNQGRTVVFVSHNMATITRLCDRLLLLDEGSLTADGPAGEVAAIYMQSGLNTRSERTWDLTRAPGDDQVRLARVACVGMDGQSNEHFDVRDEITVEIDCEILDSCPITPIIVVSHEQGTFVFSSVQVDDEANAQSRPLGTHRSSVKIPSHFLSEGGYLIQVLIATMEPYRRHLKETDAVGFQVVDKGEGISARGRYAGGLPGVVRPLLEWSNSSIS